MTVSLMHDHFGHNKWCIKKTVAVAKWTTRIWLACHLDVWFGFRIFYQVGGQQKMTFLIPVVHLIYVYLIHHNHLGKKDPCLLIMTHINMIRLYSAYRKHIIMYTTWNLALELGTTSTRWCWRAKANPAPSL